MKINKSDAQTEMEMNMTPMIDVVFLLIIFFMIITDMSQQDLEELKLPSARAAVPDEPDPKKVRPVLNVPVSGNVIVKLERIYEPEKDGDDVSRLERYLLDQARLMRAAGDVKPLGPGSSIMLPDNPVLIRADKNTEFKYVQKIMALCGKQEIQIWKVQLAAAEDKVEEEEGGGD
jgi:biopolymer transport protein ExbD